MHWYVQPTRHGRMITCDLRVGGGCARACSLAPHHETAQDVEKRIRELANLVKKALLNVAT